MADKTLFCFCHWGGQNVVRNDGSVTYVGGVTDQITVKSGVTYDAFTKAVFNRLRIEPYGKVLHFTVKFNKTQFIRLTDQEGVDNLIQFNDDFVHVYVEDAIVAAAIAVSIRGSTADIQAIQNQSGERHLGGDQIASATSRSDSTPLASAMSHETILEQGQAFENADVFREAIFKYAIAKKFTYKYLCNAPKYMQLKCAVDGCPWKLTAGLEGSSNHVSVKTFKDKHSHSAMDQVSCKPRMMAKLMGKNIQEKILDSPTYLPQELYDESVKNLAIKLTKTQESAMKRKAKQVIDGKLEPFFKLIPWLCNRLMELMPGTIAKWSSTEDNIFKQLFVSYECSIRGFHVGCRPLIFIDIRHLSGPCTSTLLAASALDANNDIYPLAYGVLTSEDKEDGLWFLEQLKLVVRDREVVIVSDRNSSILSGVDEIFGAENHARCFRDVQEHFNTFIDTNHKFKLQSKGKETAHRYLNEIAHARTTGAYEKALARMCTYRKDLYDWVMSSQPELWSNNFFKKSRWDCLNSNVAESFSAWSENLSLLQIPLLVEPNRVKLSQILLNKQAEVNNWKLPIGPRIEEKIRQNEKLSHVLVATLLSEFEAEVQESCAEKQVVDLKLGTCTCLEWQMTGIPCRHGCCAIALAHMDVYQCVADWYKREMQELIYAEVMHDVPLIEIPRPDEESVSGLPMDEKASSSQDNVILAPCAPRIKRPRGRPKTRPNGAPRTLVKPIKCSRCSGKGHNRKTCKEPS
ncbi:hypothetical protein Acr_28g0014990 [Actinidia rufa]|uniref:SWIM-type domain-containing protein n=1 Tax=Actinidia rufa TaxID=165716 RepID=A0A7J0HDK3_9ERIC|nr:hypothetical protein Acr_28g0014990 [Actinidia rufa]